MNSTALLALFRADVRDEAEPYLWSDAEIFSYMDDAQKMFCRMQGGIADATSAITQLAVTAGTEFSSLSPLILKLRAARDANTGRDIELLNYEDIQFGRSGVVCDYGVLSGYKLDSTPGEVRALVEGMEPNKIRWVRIPSQDITVKILVYRMPLQSITGANQSLEIDEHHHLHLLHWMKHLAHQKQDAETYDRGRAEQFRTEFIGYCDRAKAEREKREHKFRTIIYGGY